MCLHNRVQGSKVPFFALRAAQGKQGSGFNTRFQVSGVRKGWKAWRLEGYKARRHEGFPALSLFSLPTSILSISVVPPPSMIAS
jgi:hypothetical protein